MVIPITKSLLVSDLLKASSDIISAAPKNITYKIMWKVNLGES